MQQSDLESNSVLNLKVDKNSAVNSDGNQNSMPDHDSAKTNALLKAQAEMVGAWLEQFDEIQNLGVLVLGQNDRALYHNQAFSDHCALPKNFNFETHFIQNWLQFLGKRGDFGQLSIPAIEDNFTQKIQQGPSLKHPVTMLTAITPPNGKIVNIKLFNWAGGITLIAEDITARSQSEHVLEMVSEIGQSGFFHFSLDIKQLQLKSAYLRAILTRNEYEKISRDGFWPLLHPDDVEPMRQKWEQALAEKSIFRETARIMTVRHGMQWFLFHTRFTFLNNGRTGSYTCHFQNVTEMLKVQGELRHSKEKIENSLKSKTKFLARISHEIRTPMNAVIGIADALIHYNNNPDIVPKLELIQSSAGNILNILDDTLDHSKMDSDSFTLNPAEANLPETLKHLAKMWKFKAAETNTKIVCVVDSSVPESLIFDRFRLEQCINNLLSNAIKFTPEGTVTLIGTTIVKNDQVQLIIAVKDTGIGMNEEQLARVFEAFQQGDKTISSRFGGTGLGMNITQKIIEKMNGKITVKSQAGVGTTFAIKLGLEALQTPKSSSQDLIDNILGETQSSDRPYEGLTVLVADDNPVNHMVIKSMLAPIVKDILTADHGQQVLEILAAQHVDVILMDIHMPIMDGLEATLAIRNSGKPWADIFIVAVTADPEYQQNRLCINLGMDEALPKPLKLAQLLTLLDKTVIRGTHKKNIPVADRDVSMQPKIAKV